MIYIVYQQVYTLDFYWYYIEHVELFLGYCLGNLFVNFGIICQEISFSQYTLISSLYGLKNKEKIPFAMNNWRCLTILSISNTFYAIIYAIIIVISN